MALLAQTPASISWTEQAALDPAIVYALHMAERERQSGEHIPILFKVLMFEDTYLCTTCPHTPASGVQPKEESQLVQCWRESWLREPVLFLV